MSNLGALNRAPFTNRKEDTMKGTIEPVDVEALAAQIICATHATEFDTNAGPGATDPAVRRQVVAFLTKEINTLFEKAA
jgi:hypothetical protein